MGRHKKVIKASKVSKVSKVNKKGCGCRKREKKCVNSNPCEECLAQNAIIDKKAKKKVKCSGDYGVIIKVKGKRGRPKGSGKKGLTIEGLIEEDKVLTECKEVLKRGRGRPKKVYANAEDDVPVVPTFTFKFLGYCPSCKLSIASGDLKVGSDEHVICPKCHKESKVSELTKTIEIERPKTKKEYFQSINSSFTWHDYNPSSSLSSVAKKEEPLLSDLEDEHIKADEDDIISKKISSEE